MKTDIEIAQEAVMEPIKNVAARCGISEDDLELYGKYKAKISDEYINSVKDNEDGKLILVTAINPTPAGEGKTTITVGLGEAFGKLGKKAVIALREPSLGPCFGIKGGAAGGGKSFLGACWLIISCMRFENIRAVVARKAIKSLKESTWNTIKTVLKNWGLKEEVNYRINNLEGTLTFWNDSVIIMKEMVDLPSDPNFERFGSSEYKIAMIDEVSEISEKAVEVLFSRLRWRIHETFKTSRMFMSTNPTTNWVRSRFVQDENGDKVECREGEAYIPFSVFDNPDIAFRQTYEAALNKIRDQATKERLLYGNWDFVEANDMAVYHNFDGSRHLITNLKEKVYDPTKPIITI